MSDHPTLRGFLIIGVIAAIVTALSLETELAVVFLILQIAFLVAIAYALYRLWRSRRGDIAMWPLRSRLVFYGAALLAIVDVVARFVTPWPEDGFQVLVFFFVLFACGFSMWRVWRSEHTYGY